MDLLERGTELRILQLALSRARDGYGSVILVSGEAGIGKTTLLRAFTSAVADESDIWMGACDDLITPRPLGVFRDMLGPSGPETPSDRDGTIERVLGELVATDRPVVMAIDDAQWADDASLDVVRYLGRRIHGLAALLCITYRPNGLVAEHPLLRVLGSLTGEAVHRIELGGLSADVVGRLARDAGLEPASLVALTGGNPFLLTEVLRAPDTAVPGPVRDAIIARLNGLPEAARALVEVLSQCPGGVEWSAIAELVPDLEAALHHAEEARLIEVVGSTIRFRHEITRWAVDKSLSDARRVAINRSVLARLETAGAELHQLIQHAALGADSEAIARYVPAAAEAAASAGAHHETEGLARLALEHEELLKPAVAATLLGRAAFAAYMLNRFGDAVRFADRSVEGWEALDDPASLGDALLVGSRTHTMTTEPQVARAYATRAVEVLEPLGESKSLALAYSTLANLDAIVTRHSEAVEWAERALNMAQRIGAKDVEAHALNYLGISRLGLGDDEGFSDLRRAVDLAAAAGHSEYLIRAAMNLGASLIWAGRHPEALPHLELAENAARDADIRFGVFHAVAQRCHVELLTGDWDRAEADLQRLLEDESDPVGSLVLPLSVLGRILCRRGDPRADELIGEAWRIAIEAGQEYRIASAGVARIELAWHQRPPEEVRALGAELLGRAAGSNTPYFQGEIRRYLRRVGTQSEPFDRCPPALAAGISGDWETAARLWSDMGATFHQAMELIESPDRETALSGLTMLDEIGAAGTAAKVRQLLRDRGWVGVPRGPRRPTRNNPVGLTDRQMDVLIHLVDGKTSVEIGDALYVSSRTVDNHVAEIMRKLGVATRGEAAAEALDRGIVEVE